MSTEILDLIPTICFSKFRTLKVELGKVGGFGAASVAVFVRRAPPRVLRCVSLMLIERLPLHKKKKKSAQKYTENTWNADKFLQKNMLSATATKPGHGFLHS